MGVLTQFLTNRDTNLEVVELDRESVFYLRLNYPKLKIVKKNKEAFTPERGTLSIDKAKKLLGYKPSFPIDKGYKKYLKWYQTFWKNEFSK